MKCILPVCKTLLLCLSFLFLCAGSVFADCTSPDAIPGSLNWNPTKERYEVCSANNKWRKIRGEAQLVSGTTTILINSSTEFVSLTTDGTTWGYLSSAASFLPSLGSNHISSSLISSTYIQLNSATDVIACGTEFTGAMRYISGTMQVCDGNDWGNVGIGIPGGTIAAFEAVTCPSGWSEYTAARGRFLRGLDNGAGNDPDWPRAAGSTQADVLGSHLHSVNPPSTGTSSNGNHNHSYTRYSGQTKRASGGSGNFWNSSSSRSTGSGGSHAHTVNIGAFNSASTGGTETRPKNVAVIFCQFNGFDSELATGVATLASLSDVSIGGATAGEALVFDGASWVPSTTVSATEITGPWDQSSSGYIRLGDVQIAWGETAEIADGGSEAVVFPAAFAEVPQVSMASLYRNSYMCAVGINATDSRTTNGFTITPAGGASNKCSWMAIGRWR